MPRLAVAAVSARMLAEAAAREGFEVVALDCFGDQDTRRASRSWHDIATPGQPLRIDGARVLAALRDLAREGAAAGWIAGAGFEARLDVLESGAAALPLLGCAPAVWRRVTAARRFFERLDALGIDHPEVRFDAPAQPAGWLGKDEGGHGGWHVRAAGASAAGAAPRYFQREAAGLPMSATFLADGRGARLLGCNEQRVQRIGSHRFVFAGAIGPLPLADAARAAVDATVQALAREFAIIGLASLDFLLDGASLAVLELNPRPSASLALYGEGWLRAHLLACREGVLADLAPPAGIAAHEIVYAGRGLRVTDDLAGRLAALPYCHDLPVAGTRLASGDPVCSHDARADQRAGLNARMAAQRAAIDTLLETAR
ncbi:MAG TPA: ATP-grasp domain-containing protein [Burkholderiaceae bacterium]